MPIRHLRIFTLRADVDAEAWAQDFRQRIAPVYARHGFRVEGGWIRAASPIPLTRGAGTDGKVPWATGSENVFICLMTRDREDDWASAAEAFYSSPEYRALGPLRGVVGRQFLFVEPTLPVTP